jgi:hypothetical protein
MNGYVAFYRGIRAEVYAETLLEGKTKALKALKVPKTKSHLMAIILAEKGGKTVTHEGAEL